MVKKWKIREKYNIELEDKFPEMDRVVLQLLYNRGLDTQDKVDIFLGPDYNKDQHDPFLFNDMERAVGIIKQIMEQDKKIVIYGDYDADGVSSTAVLYLTLKRLGVKNLEVYIPNRLKEGYGMNKDAIEYLSKKGVSLIVTVDCGVTNVEAIKLAKEKNIKVIVTDHHQVGEILPPADAIICNTVKGEKYPFKDLAGVGVSFKLSQALLRRDKSQDNQAFEKWLLDIVAIGTVADMVPLLGENRVLVKWGLLVLNKTQRRGLKELIDSIRVKGMLGTYNIGFQIAPRLNAAGRMDHANTAFEILITDDEVEAMAISNDLNEKNRQRQKTTEEMMKISLEQIGDPSDNDKILFSVYDGWSAGLVGLVAGRLSDRFHRPVLVFGKTGEKYIGSGRSIIELDITQSLKEVSDLLLAFGGHRQACGATIVGEDNFKKFKEKISLNVNKKLKGVELVPHVEIEAEIKLSQADWELVDYKNKFEPFGKDNEEPVFLTRNLKVYDIIIMGTAGQHLRLDLEDPDFPKPKKFVGFGMVERWGEELKRGDSVDVVYKLSVNEWNGNREIEFRIVDLKKNN